MTELPFLGAPQLGTTTDLPTITPSASSRALFDESDAPQKSACATSYEHLCSSFAARRPAVQNDASDAFAAHSSATTRSRRRMAPASSSIERTATRSPVSFPSRPERVFGRAGRRREPRGAHRIRRLAANRVRPARKLTRRPVAVLSMSSMLAPFALLDLSLPKSAPQTHRTRHADELAALAAKLEREWLVSGCRARGFLRRVGFMKRAAPMSGGCDGGRSGSFRVAPRPKKATL